MATLKIGNLEKQDALVSEIQRVTILRESEKAILVSQEIAYEGRDPAGYGERNIREHLKCTIADEIDLETLTVIRREWLPKSQIEVMDGEIVIPDWLANQKFFVYF